MTSPSAPDAGDPLEREGLGRLMFSNLRTLVGSRVAVTVLQFLAFATLAAHLQARGLGIYSFAVVLATLFKPFSNFGFQSVTTREVAQGRSDPGVLVPSLVTVRLVLGVTIYGLLGLTVMFGGYSQLERSAALIAGLAVITTALDSFQTILEVKLRLGWLAIADMVEAGVFCGGVIVLSLRGSGPLPFVWLYVAANFLNTAMTAGAAVRLQQFRWRPRIQPCLPVIRSALPLGLSGLFIALYYRMDVAILAAFKSPADVGQYGVGYKFLETLNVLPGLAMSVLNPVLARSVLLGKAVLQHRYTSAMHLMSLAGMVVGVTGAMTAARTLPELPGFGNYRGAGTSLAILAPAATFIFIGTGLSGVLINAHQQRKLFWISGGALVINLVLNLVLIPPFSYRGAAVATTASELSVVVASLWSVNRTLGLRWPMHRFKQSMMCMAALAGALLPGYLLHPFAQLAIGGTFFLLALVPTGAFTFADLAPLLRSTGSSVALFTGKPISGPGFAALHLPSTVRVVHANRAPDSIDTSVRALRRELRGSVRCTIVDNGIGGVTKACLAARLAGCRHVDVIELEPSRPARRALWRFLTDQDAGASSVPS